MDVVHLQDKKYTITYHNGNMQFYRHGEEWPAGNELRYTNVVAALVQRVVELEEAADLAKNFFDLDKLSYDMIREAYDEAFGPHDPNITGNDIDYHIKELIKNAAKNDRELGVQQAIEMNENMASYGTIDKPICKLIEDAGNDGVPAASVQPAASLVRAGWGHCNCDPNKSKNCEGFCEAPTDETAPAPVDATEQKPYGWIQFIDGVKTQNFARDEKELADIKMMFRLMKHTGKAEYVPVYATPTAAILNLNKKGGAA